MSHAWILAYRAKDITVHEIAAYLNRQPRWHPIGKQTGTLRAALESAFDRISPSGLIASSAMFLIWILSIA